MRKLLMLKISMFFISALLYMGCSVGPEDTTPGSCSLDCSKARIGGAEFVIKPFTGLAERSMVCKSSFPNGFTEPLSKPEVFKFTVERQIMKSTIIEGGKVKEEAQSTPVANISILPIISGALYAEATHVDNDVANNPTYSGIRTPKSEWCSDTCGTVSLEVWPLCVQKAENNVTVVVQSGSANSEPAIMSILNPEE